MSFVTYINTLKRVPETSKGRINAWDHSEKLKIEELMQNSCRKTTALLNLGASISQILTNE